MKGSVAAAAIALLALPTLARAADAGPIHADLTLTAATDYVWRGASQTDEKPAVFAAVNLSARGFYLGAGTENVDFPGIRQEYDLWGGYAHAIGPVTLDVGFVRYGYVDAPKRIDTLEGKARASARLGTATVHVAGFFTGNFFGTGRSAQYLEAGLALPLGHGFDASGAIGRQHVDLAGASYTTWNLGLSYVPMKGMRLGVRYHDTDTARFGARGKGRVVGTFSLGL